MRRHDDLYRQGIVIEAQHTRIPRRRFLYFLPHLAWPRGTDAGLHRDGPDEYLSRLLSWLDPRQSPLLVQLPETQYEQCANAGTFPNVDTTPLRRLYFPGDPHRRQ